MRPSGAALLLSQVGGHVQQRFAERVGELGLTPPQVAVLRTVAAEPGLNQQAVAARLGVAPSKVVQLVDELERRGLVVRQRAVHDRRSQELTLSADAADELRRVRDVVARHDRDVTAALAPDEVVQLVRLLARIAEQQGLTPAGPPSPAGSPG